MAGDMPMDTSARTTSLLTYDDFLHFPDDGRRHELIGGVHYVTPSPNVRHQLLVGRLHLSIGVFLQTHPHIGEVFLSPLDVVLSHYDVVEPDLLFVASAQSDILTTANVQGPPALVVEVMSPSTRQRDARLKRQLFERTGVQEYWLVDPERDLVQVLRRDGDAFVAAADVVADRDGILTTPLLPGWQLPVRALFRNQQ